MKRADDKSRQTTSTPSENAGEGEGERELLGLPWFRTWRGVYVLVLGSFVLYVILLTVFSRVFS